MNTLATIGELLNKEQVKARPFNLNILKPKPAFYKPDPETYRNERRELKKFKLEAKCGR